ncbi:hypothetical protein APX01_18625 [Cereibacter sphaeroides]|nr:hypothetical protein APX01_18625 [Cereibacter sphaeroides]ANS36274.1 hypothetical protein A3858_18630 [Cereibacter sphaeroides]ATN65331.1 hypothetical protein A3857_18655 [Cereibacter sphaeroides]
MVSGLQTLAFFRGGMTAAAPREAMALWHLRVSKAPSAGTVAMSWSGGIWSSSSGSIGASPTSLMVSWAARISSDFSSIPMWILRQTRRFGPPCLRAFHSPSPLHLDTCAVDQQVQRTVRTAVGDVDLQGLLAP